MSSSQRKRIGRYKILETLPAGGMAEVFVAERKGLEGPIVLKRMRMGIGDNNVISKRFIREAQVASRLDHPNIARVYDASVEDGALCMAVELVRGHDLAAIMYELSKRKIRVPYPVGLNVVLRVLDGLHYAHTFRSDGTHLEIVHRDAGPRNVMVGYRGEVKIIDFGLAKAGFGQVLTASGVLLGTPRYMAPEQARGEVVDARADVYSAAVTLWELMSGRALIRDTEPMDALRTVLEQTPPRLSDVDPRAPRELTPVLERALHKDRVRRQATAKELKADIERAARRHPVASDREVGAFLAKQFPPRTRSDSEAGALAAEMSWAHSDAETLVLDPEGDTFDMPMAREETPTAPETAALRHKTIDLTLPQKRERPAKSRDFWRVAAYVLAAIAIVMLGIASYMVAAG